MTCPWASASIAMSSNSRRVRSMPTPPTNAWNWSGRISTSPITSGPASTRASARLRRRTTASSGTGLASTRYCQPALSTRFARTCRKPVSESSTAMRIAGCVIWSAGYDRGPTPCVRITAWSQVGARCVAEFPEQAGNYERDLLPHVDGVVADPLHRTRHEHHRHRPLADVRVVPDLDRAVEALAVELVDLRVLAHEVLGQLHVAERERLLRLAHLGARQRAHPLDLGEDLLVYRRLVAGDRKQLCDVDALVAHPLGVLDHVQQRRDDPQVGGDRRLQRQQRQDPLVHLQVAPVDPVVVGDHDRGELDVAVMERIERAIQRHHDEVERSQRLLLEPRQLLLEVDAMRGGRHYPNLPVT